MTNLEKNVRDPLRENYNACNTFSQYSLMKRTSYEKLISGLQEPTLTLGLYGQSLTKIRRKDSKMPIYKEITKMQTY